MAGIQDSLGENDLIIDTVSGFAVNVPAQDQKPDYWWITYPEHYAMILELRKALGLNIVDVLVKPSSDDAIEELFGEGK